MTTLIRQFNVMYIQFNVMYIYLPSTTSFAEVIAEVDDHYTSLIPVTVVMQDTKTHSQVAL